MRFRRSAFTLVELLVVIAIIGILVALLMPAVQQARESGRRTHCGNNLRQMGTAMHSYKAQHAGVFPYGSQGGGKHGFFSFILPFIEQTSVYEDLDMTAGGQGSPHRYTDIPVYICPSYPHPHIGLAGQVNYTYQQGAYTTYQGVGGAMRLQNGVAYEKDEIDQYDGDNEPRVTKTSHGALPHNGFFVYGFRRNEAQISDGLSNTLALGEFVHRDFVGGGYEPVPGNVRPWIFGDNNAGKGSYAYKVCEFTPNTRLDRIADGIPFNHLPMGSYHSGVTLFVYADGSVHSLLDSINFDTYQAMATCNGREVFEMP